MAKNSIKPSPDYAPFLVIEYPLIDSLIFWSFAGNTVASHFKTGSHLNTDSTSIKVNLSRFAIPPNTNLIYLDARSRLNL